MGCGGLRTAAFACCYASPSTQDRWQLIFNYEHDIYVTQSLLQLKTIRPEFAREHRAKSAATMPALPGGDATRPPGSQLLAAAGITKFLLRILPSSNNYRASQLQSISRLKSRIPAQTDKRRLLELFSASASRSHPDCRAIAMLAYNMRMPTMSTPSAPHRRRAGKSSLFCCNALGEGGTSSGQVTS